MCDAEQQEAMHMHSTAAERSKRGMSSFSYAKCGRQWSSTYIWISCKAKSHRLNIWKRLPDFEVVDGLDVFILQQWTHHCRSHFCQPTFGLQDMHASPLMHRVGYTMHCATSACQP